MQSIIRIWFLATAVFLAGAFIWAFVPVLVPVILLALGIGGLVAVIVGAARRLERSRAKARPHGE